MKELYNENYKILLKEMKEDVNKWKHILCPQTGRLKIKVSIRFKVICRLNAILFKIPMKVFFFCKNRKIQLKIHMVSQQAPKSQNNLEKEQSWRTHTS